MIAEQRLAATGIALGGFVAIALACLVAVGIARTAAKRRAHESGRMNRTRARAWLTRAVLLVVLAASTAGSNPVPARPTVLVLHDSGGSSGALGEEYALMLQNLLGHFDVDVVTSPVTKYDAVRGKHFLTAIYVGSTYDEPFTYPAGSTERQSWSNFVADVATGRLPTAWLGFNLWHLTWHWDPAWGTSFASRFGFTFDGLNKTSQFNRVTYKGIDLDKGVVHWADPGADLSACASEPKTGYFDCDTAAGLTSITDSGKATVVATVRSTVTGIQAPYAVHGGTLWYLADVPFTYRSEEDRYLVIADLLHDMLGMPGVESHQALVRFEDVNARTPNAALSAAADLLQTAGIPFSIAAIPIFVDPKGVNNKGRPMEQSLAVSDTGNLVRQLNEAGADVVQHGTTHQWSGGPNPYSMVTGDDFEFYRVTAPSSGALAFVGAIPGDSANWAIQRVNAGRSELKKLNLRVLGWEAPHYSQSATDAQAIRTIYSVAYSRSLYFTAGGRNFGQFFPYPVTDVYGFKVIPEDLGDVSPDSWNGYAPSSVDDILRRASKQLVVRDGFASFFFHPYLDPSMLKRAVDGIQALGYHFVRACSVVNSCQ